jgi:hypothetical protein
MEEQDSLRKIDLFMRVRPPDIAKKLKALKNWSHLIEPALTMVWKWNTVVFQFNNRDLMYLTVSKNDEVKVGFSEGAKLKHQNLLLGGDKIFVRQLLIVVTKGCQHDFETVLRDALELSVANAHKKLFAKNSK